MDYYEILGVAPDCDRETLHRAFRELSMKFHPDRYTETARKLAEKRYQKMVKAFNTLKDRTLRDRYDRLHKVYENETLKDAPPGPAQSAPQRPTTLSRPSKGISLNKVDPEKLAKQHYQAGVAKFNKGELPAALEHFDACEEKYQKDPEFYYYKGQCELNLPALHRKAVASFQKATQLQPKQVKYHVLLIKALDSFGLKSRVSAAMERAMRMVPDHPELMRMDQELHPDKYKKGIFRNLFGKK